MTHLYKILASVIFMLHLTSVVAAPSDTAKVPEPSPASPGSTPAASSAPENYGNGPRTINIDNPSFRKLIVAIPDFALEIPTDNELLSFQKQAKEDMPFLLQFTGFFKTIAQDAFTGKGEQEKLDELAFWRMISVDTVVKGKFHKVGKFAMLELTGIDVYRGRVLDKKRYEIRSEEQLYSALKRYIDYLLESYTGKPGIFQSKIVFAGKKTKSSAREIFICDPDGHNVEQLTKSSAIHISPSWDPTGTKVVFTSYESGKPNIYQQDIRTKKTALIPGLASGNKGTMNSGGKFSPNAKLIVYTQITEGNAERSGKSEIYLVPPGGGIRRPFIVGHGIDVDPIFSPDGKWLAYASGRYGNPHLFRAELVWNSDFTDVKVKGDARLTYAGWWNAMPTWSPDSQKIAFAGFDKDINRFDIFLMNYDGSKLERLTLQSGDNKSPSFSPNGQMLVFHSSRVGTASDRGRNQLFMMSADGSDQRVISTGLYSSEDPKWGPYLRKDD